MQGGLGTAPCGGSHLSHAELGDGVQEVVPCIQAADVLRQRPREAAQTAGLVQAQCLPCLHHLIYSHPPGEPSPLHYNILKYYQSTSTACKLIDGAMEVMANAQLVWPDLSDCLVEA